ncbi:MAG: DUF2069 domain-containing protein [Nitrosomonadales bacterium]|jgi:uncharacterized membrane protein|nr:DUF2069 domain-containing protein [Nitrosomonadales bacterium]MCH9781265.1 DUF2069 domain-containing protein [Betaproteobacteria bacterium]MDA7751557.1 DUF2069 domain-containing protein [Methylophilaceae bacterium]MBT6140658.1 DUF2069 domain-containing protein [Nitrosomonadales bacterium]MCH9842055.1 DUF2069 domain-containing protein [Betaproteobacteria bacterium]
MDNKLFYIAIYSLMSLVLLNLVWELFFNPLNPNGSWMVIKSLLLLTPLLGILRRKRRTFQWSSMVILLFFIEGVVRFYAESGFSKSFAMGEIILSLTFFLSAIFYCKYNR